MPKAESFSDKDFAKLDPHQYILVKGARVNNLKNLSVAIPRNKMVVITGLSGSGKSSLAFDTLFAEGQRMYVESLSSYARQFLGRMEKPEVDYIKGVSPAIAIEQKVNTRNPRSTVGTTTEIYDYLKLLYARIGVTYSPVSGKAVRRDTVSEVVNYVLNHKAGLKYLVLYPLLVDTTTKLHLELKVLLSKGYTRLFIDDKVHFIDQILTSGNPFAEGHDLSVIVDRAVVANDEDSQFRLADSIQTAFFEGHGECLISFPDKGTRTFSDRFEMDGIKFEVPSVNLFSFNNPYGACRTCGGFGKILGIDEDLVIPDKSLSLYDGAIAPWRSETMKKWLNRFLEATENFEFPVHKPFIELSSEHIKLLWDGNKQFKGIHQFFKFVESRTHKIQYRVLLSRYRGRRECPDCHGTRIRRDASYVKVADKSIANLMLMPLEELKGFFEDLAVSSYDKEIAGRLLKEIRFRLDYINHVGLGYLTLNRMTSTLSGGEYQRIKLATSLGSALVGSMYILDEPSIGLHPRDTQRLISVLESLRDVGNTVIIVEHEEEIMRAADQIVDIGPAAGTHGGHLVFQGTVNDMNGTDSYTARYLNGTDVIPVPKQRRKWSEKIRILGARQNNLKNIDVDFPIGVITVVTGVSGSGKSTLVRNILYPAIGKKLGIISDSTGKFNRIEGELDRIEQVQFVDQNPVGKSSRSNPVTYVKAYDSIRQLFAEQPIAKQRGYKPAHFSFNIDGGRCETCQGEGTVKVEMQFMADIYLVCESCKGARFKKEILDVKIQDKNVAEVLEMTIEESLDFFQNERGIVNRISPLQQVGLGYVRLGQSSNSLSGGEAQRVKLASFLGKSDTSSSEHVLFIFDEPTTGLHFHDINNLMKAINALVNRGNSVVIIEHNIEVIKSADWIIDLGPEGGGRGGEVLFTGTPEQMIREPENITAVYLRAKMS